MKKIVIFILFLLPGVLRAQSSSLTDSLRAVITRTPGDVAAHKAFVQAMIRDSAGLVKQYQVWMKKYPKTAAVAYGLGSYYAGGENPAAKPYLLKAVALDPHLAEAWVELATDAQRWGEFKKSDEYLANAVKAEPDNPDYLFYYANSLESSDPAKSAELIKTMFAKFPHSERCAQALYWQAFRASNTQQRIAAYEQLRAGFPIAHSMWASAGMQEYVDELLRSDAGAALQVAGSLLQQPGLDSSLTADLEKKQQLAATFVHVQSLLAAHDPAGANAALTGVKVSNWGTEQESLSLLKARIALQMGGPQQAYDTLLSAYVKNPARAIKDTLLYYAGKAGKTEAAAYTAIKQQLMTQAQPADFKLEPYLSSGSISLNDYKGKVVLLTFWFPGCGPCRGEFPHFEKVLKGFREVAFVGINVVRQQDSYVIPFMKSSGYSFTPLKDVEANRHNLPVFGAPTNYLIDQEGRIIFRNFMIQNMEEEQMLQDMITLLLHKAA